MRHGNESFKVKEGRFNYYDSKAKQGKLPGPGTNDHPSSFTGKKEYSVGVSRSNMNPLFIDKINTFAGKNKNQPSPCSYRATSTITEGVKYSMRPKQIRYGEKDENFSQNYLDR